MAKDHGPSVKDDKLYEELREDGAGKESAAVRRGDSPTRSELTEARRLGIDGRSKMGQGRAQASGRAGEALSLTRARGKATSATPGMAVWATALDSARAALRETG